MNTVIAWIDGQATGFNFTIDTNTVMLGLITVMLGIIGWFTRKWGLSIETQIAAIHVDMKEHNDKSDKTHNRIFTAIAIDEQRIAKIEGKMEAED